MIGDLMRDFPETKEELFDYVVAKYEQEIRISKRVLFCSLPVLILTLVWLSFNRPVSTEMFVVFVIIFSISAALVFTSLQCYFLSKSYLLRWKQRGL